MSREEQAKKDCAIIVSDDMEYGTHVSTAYNKIGVYTMAEYVDNQDGRGYHFHDLLDPEEIYDDSIKDQDVVAWKELPQPPKFDLT